MIKTIRFKGNDILSYAEVGSPGGFPVLVQHGMIASIRDTHLFARLVGRGARLICIARPGYGESSAYEMKDMAEWGQIVGVLVDVLGLKSFDVFGISSGAPYSYAIADRFPEKTRHLFILSGTPALYDEEVRACWPYPLDPQAGIVALQALAARLFFSDLSPAELARADIHDSMMNQCFGIAQDLLLRCNDWGFQLEDIRVNTIMRHSRADGSVPFVTAERTAQLLPHCRLEAREHDEHFSQAVLDDFIETAMAPVYL